MEFPLRHRVKSTITVGLSDLVWLLCGNISEREREKLPVTFWGFHLWRPQNFRIFWAPSPIAPLSAFSRNLPYWAPLLCPIFQDPLTSTDVINGSSQRWLATFPSLSLRNIATQKPNKIRQLNSDGWFTSHGVWEETPHNAAGIYGVNGWWLISHKMRKYTLLTFSRSTRKLIITTLLTLNSFGVIGPHDTFLLICSFVHEHLLSG